MREITSKDNRIFKLCEQLALRKYRDRFSEYIIEGENLVAEALKTGAEIEALICRRGYTKIPRELLSKTFVLEEKLFDRLAQTETSQGILAIVKKTEISKDMFAGERGSNFVVLDRLQDPGNIGTILRTADAAGYRLAIVMKGTADVFSPKTVRAAAGSLFRMPVVFMDSNSELVEFSGAAGKKLVATCFDTERYYFDEDLTKDIALIIGNEGNGISQELMESSDSLNASVAAGILMYEAVRGKKG